MIITAIGNNTKKNDNKNNISNFKIAVRSERPVKVFKK